MTGDLVFGTRHQNLQGYDVSFHEMVEWVRRAESLGFESVHIPGRLLASAPGIYESTTYAQLPTLAATAARTDSIDLGPMILVTPYYHPVAIAEEYGTLDVISDGRLVLGVGSGWFDREFQALGVPRSERGRRLEEGTEIIKRLWTEDSVTYEGEVFSLEDVSIAPKPVQDPHPPIWFGSFSPQIDEFTPIVDHALERVGRLGDGWAPLVYSAEGKQRLDPAKLGQAWSRIERGARDTGRDPSDIEIVYSHWFFIEEGPADQSLCEETLEGWFSGTYEQARDTYLIGTPEEIVEEVLAVTADLPRVDRFTIGPLSYEPSQLERYVDDVMPRLESHF